MTDVNLCDNCGHSDECHIDGIGECDAWIGSDRDGEVCRCRRFRELDPDPGAYADANGHD